MTVATYRMDYKIGLYDRYIYYDKNGNKDTVYKGNFKKNSAENW